MAYRKIIVEFDSVLHMSCRCVNRFDNKLKMLVDDLFETLSKTDGGVGLAAPQVGILKRIAVIKLSQKAITLINPEIIESSGVQKGLEGCLSFPGKQIEVERPSFVKVKAFDEKGNEVFYEGRNLLARAFCHEIDHLNGIVFLDRVLIENKV